MSILSVWLWKFSLPLSGAGYRFALHGWRSRKQILSVLFVFLGGVLALPAVAKPSKKNSASRSSGHTRAAVQSSAVEISSDFFELTPDRQRALWKGRVMVMRDDMKVRCDVLIADYDQNNRLKRFTCKGNAHMQQAAGKGHEEREVWGKIATFDNEKAQLTVRGSPKAREGKNTARGEKIIFLTRSDRLIVEKAVFHIESSDGSRLPRPSPVLTKEKK